MNLSLLFISGAELILVLFVFLLLFGSKKIPDFARSLGKGLNEFKKATDEIKREISENVKDVNNEANEIKKDINPS
jgi:sec-independent protein translocase protein TatA